MLGGQRFRATQENAKEQSMFECIKPAPDNVLAIKSVGQITDDDYKMVLIPAVEDQIKAHGKVRLVYVIGPEFEGHDMKAAIDDAFLGLDHWWDFKRIAVVTDRDWITKAMRIFLPLLRARKKLFGIAQIDDAVKWAAS